ncbi:Nif3-like dinuclear metal center hexameric protein [Paenibacillus yanchengensis]|uniref:GTP cyclohydrolase 1 type 2 homolog n=1 Tax=Paenibacillus yanchengensis TaxID=2035833 RepID=A0ABW4YKA6_9BACL
MLINGQTLIQHLDRLAPKKMAVEHDRIGLQVGTLNKSITTALVTLDVTDAVVEEAIAKGAELIIAHHAIIFRPLPKIDTATASGKLIEKLIKHDIAVYIAHTNLDVATGGVNDWLADRLGIQEANRSFLEEVYTDRWLKLVVYVPKPHLEAVQQAIWQAGGGQLGNYSECSFTVDGTGTFKAGEGATPFSGSIDQLHHAEEVKLETVIAASLQSKIVQAMIKAHPYEEVAYDLFPNEIKGTSYGLGRMGRLAESTTLGEYAEEVKKALQLSAVRIVGNVQTKVAKVAVLGGSGAKYVNKAKFAGADTIVTGDIDFHTAQDALADGMTIIDAGHHIEQIMITELANWLSHQITTYNNKVTTTIVASTINTDPFQFI